MSASSAPMVGAEHRAGRADGLGEVRPLQVLADALEGDEEEGLVLHDRAAEGAAELLAVEVLQGLAVGRVGGQALEALEVEEAAVEVVACPTW